MGWTPASGPFLLCRLGALEDWVGRLSCDSRKNPRDWEHEGLHAVPFSPPEPISLIHERVLAASNNPFLFLEKIWERNHFPLINLRPSGVSALDRPLHTSGAAEGQSELRAQSPKLSRTWAGRLLKTRAAPCLGSHPSARRESRPWREECHLPSSSQAELGPGGLLTTVLSGEKFQDRVVCCTWLVGLENVAGMREQDEFGTRNTFGD
jgi:hypothetical protein